MTEGEACRVLGWDSGFFGFPVARVVSSRLDAEAIRAVDGWCAVHRPRCLYWLASAGDAASMGVACGGGFEPVDVRMTFAIGGWDAAPRRGGAGIREATEDDVAALGPAARSLHRQTRFFADGRFPRERAESLYETWLARSIRGEIADGVLVADRGEGAVGYATYSRTGDEGTIGLVGVTPAHQGRGIGRSLVGALLDRFAELGVRRASVATQGGNAAAARLYEACGFRLDRVDVWFHRWTPQAGSGDS